MIYVPVTNAVPYLAMTKEKIHTIVTPGNQIMCRKGFELSKDTDHLYKTFLAW